MNFKNLLFTLFFLSIQGYAQTSIKMRKDGGVFIIPCKVNGLDLEFIFDTGASDVSISLSEAIFMLKNGYLNENDIKGSTYYQVANGDIVKGTVINLREIKIGNRFLYNVQASITHSLSAPLLLGQTALSKIGKFSFDYSTNILQIDDIEQNTYNGTNRVKSENSNQLTTTLKDDASLKDKPHPLSNIKRRLSKNQKITVLGFEKDYWNVFYDGDIGFIHDMFLNVTYDMASLKNKDTNTSNVITTTTTTTTNNNNNIQVIDGFRIQLMATTDRLKVDEAQSYFATRYPGVYIGWSQAQPYYKVRVGGFSSRTNASNFLKKIRKEYPDAYIVLDRVKTTEITPN